MATDKKKIIIVLIPLLTIEKHGIGCFYQNQDLQDSPLVELARHEYLESELYQALKFIVDHIIGHILSL